MDHRHIFISAVSSEFGQARVELARVLSGSGMVVREQSQIKAHPQGDTLLGKLHAFIKDCTFVICMIGDRSGSKPQVSEANAYRNLLPEVCQDAWSEWSYTQWEFFIALHYNIPRITIQAEGFEPEMPGDSDAQQGVFLDFLRKRGTDLTTKARDAKDFQIAAQQALWLLNLVDRRTSETLTIIIPAYKETHRLPDLIKSLSGEGLIYKYRTILCDDGSGDGTFEVSERLTRQFSHVECIQMRTNTRKVGAIKEMAQMANTPFVLTLDADCGLEEDESCALDAFTDKMAWVGISACCFRIIPSATNWLGKLQMIDYAIFTDSLRNILGVPLCLIGQGVVWKREDLLQVLSLHSGIFEGDDLENTVIALNQGMKLHWERGTTIITTTPKRKPPALLRQRALSWDFGLLRVLASRRVLMLRGESGAFYKIILLADFVAHPFKLLAIPLLMSVPVANYLGALRTSGNVGKSYVWSVSFTLKYGALAISVIWVLCAVASAICVIRLVPSMRSIRSLIKWMACSFLYLSSPFAYFMFYPLLSASGLDAYDTIGTAIRWLGLGLLITYLWWLLLTSLVFLGSAHDSTGFRKRPTRYDLCWNLPLMPLYYLVLIVVAKTVGITKFMLHLRRGR